MNRVFILLFCLVCSCASAQQYARVSISYSPETLPILLKSGIETDHGAIVPGRMLTTDLSYPEIEYLKAGGVNVKVLIPDVQDWYVRQNKELTHSKMIDEFSCSDLTQKVTQFPTPLNYTAGSMGGYLTYQEILDALDMMRTKFPDLVSARTIMSDTIITHDGNPIWWVRISDNPDTEEPEPQLLHTALHHAREPGGMTQMIFFMWYLLENYDTHPEVKGLVDNAELYFVPCVNPDGYLYNESTNPEGGGLWRKNRLDNGDGTFGVDLNRNYGYQWGVDNQGSSDLPNSSTYRGPAPFSEPETRMIRDFCSAHNFGIALNYHVFGNLLIYPWAFSNASADTYFPYLAEGLVSQNGYRPGPPIFTVGYPVNGSSDDWMFAEPGIFSYTPESGPSSLGFWPPADTIDFFNKRNMYANLMTGWSLLNFAVAKDLMTNEIFEKDFSVPVDVKRYGLQDGTFTVDVNAISANTIISSAPQSISLGPMTSDTLFFTGTIAQQAQTGDTVILEITIDNGIWTQRDTVLKIFTNGPRIPVFADVFDEGNNWQGGWKLTTEDFYSPPTSWTDSPAEPYFNNAVNATTTASYYSIPDKPFPTLSFYAKWSVEAGYDWVQTEALDSDGNVFPLCGRYSHAGTTNQPQGIPLWDGSQLNWVEELIDLSDFKGKSIKIRWSLHSDSELVLDGFYIDDVMISYIDSMTISGTTPDHFGKKFSIYPSPADEITYLKWSPAGQSDGQFSLEIVNQLGQPVLYRDIPAQATGSLPLNISGWLPGIYTWFITTDGRRSAGNKLLVR